MSLDTHSIVESESDGDISTLPLSRPPSYIEDPSTRASSFDGDMGTLSLSRPPSYCGVSSIGTAPATTSSSRASTVESSKKPIASILDNPFKYFAVACWVVFLFLIGLVTMLITPQYSFIFWASVILTIMMALIVCSSRGSKIHRQVKQERLRREAEEERLKRPYELPEGHFLVIDEMAQVGHGHSVVTLLPPPPNYEDPAPSEFITVVVIPSADEPNSV